MDSVGGNASLIKCEGDAAPSSQLLSLTGGLLDLVQRSFLSDFGHTSRLRLFVYGWNELRMKRNPLGPDAKNGRELLTNTTHGPKQENYCYTRIVLSYLKPLPQTLSALRIDY